MASSGNKWSGAGSGSGPPTDAGVSFFPDTDSFSESEDLKITRFSEIVGVNVDPMAKDAADAATE